MYQQIVDTLRSEILRGKYHASGNLGTHKELAERFGVSMITIRKAMQLLAEEGLVDIKQGKGTFVRDSVPQDSLRSQSRQSVPEFLAAPPLSSPPL